MRYFKVKSVLLFLVFAAALAACKKEVNSIETKTERLQKPHGAVTGTPVSKTIGPEGGAIQSRDGNISVTIPAGAVATATEFKIQPVENTLPGSPGPAYRLLPEGVAFAKPVTIRFSYASVNVPAKLLALAYQDHNGYFHVMQKTERNTTDKTLSVQTTHFSDWLIFNFVGVTPNGATVRTGGTVEFTLFKSPLAVAESPTIDESDILSPLPYTPENTIDWYKSTGGVGGILVSSGATAQYTAPNVPGVQHVVCKVDNVLYDGENLGQLQFVTEVTVVESSTTNNSHADSYIKLQIDGADTITLRYNIGGSFYNNTAISGTFTNNPYDPRQISILINAPVSPNDEFFYKQLSQPRAAQINLAPGFVGKYLASSSCVNPVAYSSGSIKITKAEPVGGFVEGTFTCNAYRNECPDKNPIVPVVGKFKIYRGF